VNFGFENTVAAISTPIGTGGIAIVRMTGKNSIDILGKVFRAAGNKDVEQIKTHTVTYGHILSDGKIVDEVLVVIMMAPRSYTKENVVEINCHGGVKVANSVLDALIKNGACIAAPGEFTKRAFINGRIDLSQAEAVIDLINAKTELSERASVNKLNGRLSKKVRELRESILTMTAAIEAAVDYPEHSDENITSKMIFENTSRILDSIGRLIKSADFGKILREGIKTVIIGKPNVGKSSLLNCIIDSERAIVTDVPGTTRDIIEEFVNINGIPLSLIDTAGIRGTDDAIEKIGVEKSMDYAENADFILFVMDGSEELSEEDYNIIDFVKGINKKTLFLINKCDLPQKVDISSISSYFGENYIINISAEKRVGIDNLFEKIKSLFFNGEIDVDDEAIISNERNKASLIRAQKSLEYVIDTINNHMPQDFLSMDLMDAFSALGEIIGETVGEDVIDKIFADFCLGK